jgi:hypothetical protein
MAMAVVSLVHGMRDELRAQKEPMKKERCRHENGWFTDHAMVWLGRDNGVTIYSDIWGRHQGKVRLRCNTAGCEAVRNIYIQRRGAKAGRPFIPKAK